MRHTGLRFAMAMALVVACTGLAGAQTPPPSPQAPSAGTRTINLTLEQRHVIRELLRDSKVTKVSDDVTVAIGDQVPGNIDLHPIPPLVGQKVPQIKAHRFFVTDRQIVIVDPQEQKVAEVIE